MNPRTIALARIGERRVLANRQSDEAWRESLRVKLARVDNLEEENRQLRERIARLERLEMWR